MKKALLAAVAAFGLAGAAHAADPVKVGFVYVGPIGDHGWSYQHDQGRLAVEKEFGDKVKTTYVENVAEGPDAERVIRQLATGNDWTPQSPPRARRPRESSRKREQSELPGMDD